MERRKMLEEFVAKNPQDSFARYGLALEKANAGETEDAIADLKRLIEASPDYTAAYQMLGQTLLKQGRSDEARAVLQRGVQAAQRGGNAHAQREMQGLLDEIED